jgi:hypothetical protein
MGCSSASIRSDRDEIAETIREAITINRDAVAMGEPAIEPMKGRIPETAITKTSAREPKIPPNPVDIDFPYPARISLNDEYMRVEAIVEPSQTPPRNPPWINTRARSMSSRTLDLIVANPPHEMRALFLTKRNCPLATANDVRELCIARRSGTVVIHVHCKSG